MPRRETEVEQGGDLHRLQQSDGGEREAFVITKFVEMLLAPGAQLPCRLLALGKTGKVGSAIGQVRGGRSRFALQHGERYRLVPDDGAETGVRRVGDYEANQFRSGVPVIFLD